MRTMAAVLYREWALFSANQSAFWLALLTPFLYLLFFLPGVGQMLADRGENYALFAFPGVLMTMALNVAQSVGAPIFFDRYTGEIETLFALPVPRSMLLAGRLITAVLRTWVQCAVAMALTLALYAPLRDLGPSVMLLLLVGSGLIAVVLSSLFILLAAVVRNQGQFNLVMNLLITPLLLTSSAFYPTQNLPVWIRWLSDVNPLSYLLADLRAIMGLQSVTWLDVTVPAVFAALVVAGAINRYQRLSR